MKALLTILATFLVGVSAMAVSADTVALTGKIVSLEKTTLTLKVDGGKVQVPKKYLANKHAVGEVVTVAVPKTEFHQLVISKTK